MGKSLPSKNIHFVTGYARSGTTLLASILGRNPNIIATPETCFFEHLYKSNGYPKKREVIRSRFLKDLNLESEVYDRNNSCTELFIDGVTEYSKSKPSAGVIVEKSPHHLCFIRRVSKEIEGSKFVVIVRDPRAIYSSLHKVPWSHNSISRFCAEWNARQKYLNDALLDKGLKNKIHVIRYEDLLSNPKSEIEKVCNFLGVVYSDSMFNVAESNIVPSWEREWKDNVNKPIDKSKIDSYKDKLSASEIDKITKLCSMGMESFGYIGSNSHEKKSLYMRILESKLYRNARLYIKRRRVYE
ncbi:sulfotransferase [Marinobacter hydrocarbonoclasticus]|nr:sulfotransferase [Marinobacter nauticus]